MLDIDSKFPSSEYAYGGSGIFDAVKNIIRKSSNSAIARKVINSVTKKNLKRAADSALGKEIKKSVLTGLTEGSKGATEEVFKKLGIEPASKRRKKKKSSKKQSKGGGIVYD